MLATLCLVFYISVFPMSTGVRILPYKIDSPDCSIPDDRETCSLQGLDGVYKGRKHWKSPNKFVLLWPIPHGDYEKVRRLCHACDLEVAEIWDEDDANQIVELLESKVEKEFGVKKASFWLGETREGATEYPAIPSDEEIQQLKFFHQDGMTPVQFHFLRGPKSFAVGYSKPSGLPDANKDCIVIGPDPKQNDKISWFVQSCRARSNFGLCQFKRKHHCYDEAPLPSTRQLQVTSTDSVTKPQPYYLSNYPLSWTLAKVVCEKTNKSLLFFDSRDEEQYFTKAFGKLLSGKEHLESGFWSAGQFEADKLKWWIGAERLTIPKYRSKEMRWNLALTNTKGRATRMDYSKGEGCVYFEGQGTPSSPNKWGIAECERSMRFFVCKDADVEFQKKSSVEYCDGENYVKKERYECKWNLMLKKKKPKCVCVEGVHGLTDHASCNSRLVIGPKCIKLSQRSVVHWKILSRSFIEKEAWLIVQLRSQTSGRFIEWFALQRNATRQIFGNANVYYAGLEAIQLDNTICFQTLSSPSKTNFYELKIRNNSSLINFAFERCPSGSQPVFRAHKIRQSITECALDPCKKPLNIYKGSLAPKSDSDVHSDVPEDVKSSIDKLNEKMLAFKIDKAFGKAKPIGDGGPTWIILKRLMSIVKRICSCLVGNSGFMDDALELFHVAHAGQEYRYVPSFTESEVGEILSMLDTCEMRVSEAPCEKNNCTGRAVKVSEKQLVVDDSGLKGGRHHHVLEIVWLAISTMNVACLKHFKPSYLQFHHLEQSLENLFTEEMKKLWHYPSVDPNYFRMLLGPNEATDLENLKSCASAVHGVNPDVMELMRPKQAKGRNLGDRIRARKLKDKQEGRGYGALTKRKKAKHNKTVAHPALNVFCSRDEFCLKW